MEKRGGGGYQGFLSKILCLTVPEEFLGEPYFGSQNFRYRKMSGIREGVIHVFPSESFVPQCRKYSSGNPSVMCFRKIPVAERLMEKKGGASRFSVEKFLSHNAEKFHRGTLLFRVSENFW